jgi:hypothetical protein
MKGVPHFVHSDCAADPQGEHELTIVREHGCLAWVCERPGCRRFFGNINSDDGRNYAKSLGYQLPREGGPNQ